jgi:hypothetical protein
MNAAHPPFAPPRLPAMVVGVQLLAVAVAVVAWYGTSGVDVPSRQLPWIGLACLAPMLSGAVNAVWILGTRRALGRRQQRMTERARRLAGELRQSGLPKETDLAAVKLVAVAGLTFYHRAGCVLVEARGCAASREDHERAGRSACGWCLPSPSPELSRR